MCLMQLPPASTARGPPLRLSLPSFSGGTADHPGLLKYSCDLATRVRLVSPAVVQVPRPLGPAGAEDSSSCCDGGELMAAVLGGKPLIAMAFDDMVVSGEEGGGGMEGTSGQIDGRGPMVNHEPCAFTRGEACVDRS